MNLCTIFFINIRINISKASTSNITFFYYFNGIAFNWCFTRIKINIYNTPLSHVTKLFNLFKPSFLLIPIKIHLNVFPFAFNIAISFKQ